MVAPTETSPSRARALPGSRFLRVNGSTYEPCANTGAVAITRAAASVPAKHAYRFRVMDASLRGLRVAYQARADLRAATTRTQDRGTPRLDPEPSRASLFLPRA